MTLEDTGVVTTIMHDTANLDAAVSFWTQILGLRVLQQDERYAYLGKLGEDGPHLAFQLVPEMKTAKNRLHLDIRVASRAAFAERVVALGGTVIGDHQEGDFPTWTVMTDPEGNEFCVYEPTTS